MSPRTRRITNTHIIATAATVVGARGAEHTRLSDIAAVSGLAPATLLQRFGSLEALLDAVSASSLERIIEAFTVYEASPMTALEASLVKIARARHLVLLMARPAGAAAYSLELRKRIAYGLVGAVEAGELVHCDVAALARRLQIGFYGITTAALLEGAEVEATDVAGLLGEVLGDLM